MWTAALKSATGLPNASNAATTTGGRITLSVITSLGCAAKPSWVGGPGTTSNAALVAAGSPSTAAARAYPLPDRSMCRSVNVATPFTAGTLRRPLSDAPPGL